MRILAALALCACNHEAPAAVNLGGSDFGFTPPDFSVSQHCPALLECEQGCRGHESCDAVCASHSPLISQQLYAALRACAAQICEGPTDAGALLDGGAALCSSSDDTSVVCQECLVATESNYGCPAEQMECEQDSGGEP